MSAAWKSYSDGASRKDPERPIPLMKELFSRSLFQDVARIPVQDPDM